MVYRDRNGKPVRESTNTADWQEAQRKLRERLQARDDKILEVVRKGEQLQFVDWVDFFLENYSKPPIRAEKTHAANERAGRHLKETFVIDRSVRSWLTTSNSTSGAASSVAFKSKLRAGSFKRTGSNRPQFIRNCGSFAVC